jgi:hypothetical protein
MLQILLNELRAEMDIELHERDIAGVLEAVNLAGFDHKDVPRAGFELLAVDDPCPAAFLNELHFVVRMAMRSRSSVRQPRNRNADTFTSPLSAPTKLYELPRSGRSCCRNFHMRACPLRIVS